MILICLWMLLANVPTATSTRHQSLRIRELKDSVLHHKDITSRPGGGFQMREQTGQERYSQPSFLSKALGTVAC